MTKIVDFETVLSLIDKSISPTYLNPTQEIVLREVWNGKTYSEMAHQHNYDPEYIKSVGCNLWHTLSRTFDEQINKSNFVPFMRQQITKLFEEKEFQFQLEERQVQSLSDSSQERQLFYWTTAPNTKHFLGREEEISILDAWSQNSDCRCILVSGMIGCGKTTLVTKFAKKIKKEFDYVIWFSLHQPPSLSTLLNKYLNLIARPTEELIASKPLELSFLLSEFVNYLKKYKILLILDDLQDIFEVNRNKVTYRQGFEEYGQFLRSIITTHHQSVLIGTSRIKPQMLEYYSSNQVRFLELQGFKPQTTKTFINLDKNTQLQEPKLIFLAEILQNNPQLLKIAKNHLDEVSEDNIEQILQELSLLEEISSLLEQELSCLSDLDKEIIYWLAIACTPVSLEELSQYIEQSQRKLKFLQSINCLIKRSLVIKNDGYYSLMPIMKVYLRRKLVTHALDSHKN